MTKNFYTYVLPGYQESEDNRGKYNKAASRNC